MKTVFKYTLRVEKGGAINVPVDAELLKCETQNHDICLWFLVETENISESRYFNVYGTSEEIKEDIKDLNYIDSVFFNNKSLVLHIFENNK